MKIFGRPFALFVLCYLGVFGFLPYLYSVRDKGLSVHVIDVGQGDSILVELDGKPLILVDGGADYTTDKYIFDRTGLRCEIPLLVLSHAHSDHYVGFRRVVERCKFVILRYNDVDLGNYVLSENIKNLHEIKINKVQNNDQLILNDVYIRFLVPFVKKSDEPKNLNNASVALFIKYGSFEALLLGDLEKEAQARLDLKALERMVEGELDVLKIAHHGAVNGYYLPLVRALNPKYCVVSVGKNNSFGHPSLSVLESLEEEGCKVLRTDEVGDVVIKSL